MQPAKPSILCTGPIDRSLLSWLEHKDVDIDFVNFTCISINTGEAVLQEINDIIQRKAVVIFTSVNAIRPVIALLDNGRVPDWVIYCLGHATYELAKKHFGPSAIRQTALNASELAERIIRDGNVTEAVFFCGNLRRDDLPDKLAQHDIRVREIIVYQTIRVPKKIEKTYGAILFFSPAAADSFFSLNTAPPETILFAIGTTTADVIKKYADNKIIIGDEPDKERLLYKAVMNLVSPLT